MSTRQGSGSPQPTPSEATGREADLARRPLVRLTPLGMFTAAFLLLLGSAAAVGMAQFWSGNLAPWLSIGYSAGAIVCTLLALLMRPPRR